MRIIIVVFAIVGLCTADQTENKEKRQIQYTSGPTQLKQLSHGYQGQHQQPTHQLQHYHSPSNEQQQQQPTTFQLGESGEEIPPEYYDAIKEFAEKQAEIIQRQQLEFGMKDLLQRAGGRVEIKNYNVDYDPKNPGSVQLPQTSASPTSYGNNQEPLVIQRPVEYIRVQPGQHQANRQSGEAAEAKAQYARLSAPQPQQYQHQQQPKFGFVPEQVPYGSTGQGQQHAQYTHAPQGPHYNSFSGHPLAGSTLEKEIAKLESSFQSQFKAQSQPEQLRPQSQALRFKAQPHQHQLQLNHQNKYAYVAPSVSKYQATDNFKSQAQPTPLTATEGGQYVSTGHPEEANGKNQYVSEVHRFYNQPPKPIRQQQPTQARYYAAQQNPNKIQFVSTEKPVEEEQEPTPKYDTSGTMKIIPAPQLQYERPSKYQQPQSTPNYYNQYKDKSPQQTQEVGHDSLNLFKSTVNGADIAPSRSSIYVSQGTGTSPVQHYNKPQAQQQYQYPNLHRQNIQQQLKNQGEQQTQHQRHQQVRLPPPNGGRPLTQDEFQALVDAGYSVTAIPVPVPVSAEQYQKQQHHQQQRHQSLNLHKDNPSFDISYDVSDERQAALSNSHAPRIIKY